MNYTELAAELIDKMGVLHKARPHKHINEALRGEACVLIYIAHTGGGVLPGEICHEMDVSTARVAATLNGLEKKGLITRRIDQNDRRKILVDLTGEGKALAKKHQRSVTEAAAKMLELLGEHDAREYTRITGRLAETLAQIEC